MFRWNHILGIVLALAVAPYPLSAQESLGWQKDSSSPVQLGAKTYPRTATDAVGGRLTMKAPPQRIVSLEYELDEYVYGVAPPERVVGVSSVAYLRSVSSVLEEVDRYKPAVAGDIETIIRLDPDLVVAAVRSKPQLVQAIEAAGIPVFRVGSLPTRLQQVAENLTIIGYVTGNDEKAAAERAKFEGEIAAIAKQCAAPHPSARIFGVSMIGYSYGDRTLFHDETRLVGAVNVSAQNGLHTYEKVGNETVLRWNPDWVFSWAEPGHHDDELRRWRSDPALGAVAAVEKNQLIVQDGREMLSLSQHATKRVHIMADALCK